MTTNGDGRVRVWFVPGTSNDPDAGPTVDEMAGAVDLSDMLAGDGFITLPDTGRWFPVTVGERLPPPRRLRWWERVAVWFGRPDPRPATFTVSMSTGQHNNLSQHDRPRKATP